jgi:hypothetical protein
MWYKKNIPAGITTITGTGGVDAGIDLIIHEVSGASITAPFTAGEFKAKNDGGTKTNNPQTTALTNATANSIIFAACENTPEATPFTHTPNGTGTVGTYAHYSANSHHDGWGTVGYNDISVVYQIVSSSTSQVHGWTTDTWYSGSIVAAFH